MHSRIRYVFIFRSYGIKGQTIIKLCLEAVFPDSSPDWNLTTIAPLSVYAFRTFVLTPTAAILLIQDDLKISFNAAMLVMVKSIPHGKYLDDCSEADAYSNFTDVSNVLLKEVEKLKAEAKAQEKERRRQAEEERTSLREMVPAKIRRVSTRATKKELLDKGIENPDYLWQGVTEDTLTTPKPPPKKTGNKGQGKRKTKK
ncbi:hypothetical protein K474DRAFT_1777017 [Panus rudis PR-1116 ss-1]|nr:hypothetical protein K474DRAFT_1777017 [Panus rudis PR-1116 ss-1]